MMNDTGVPAASVRRPAIPTGVWALGFVSLFMDMSSELTHAVLPLFLVGGLGASMLMLGIIEGVAEAATLVIKVFSGAISDALGRRKLLVVAGYGMSALVKPLFPLATTVGLVFGARLVDRVGKGIRGAPRDALIADLSPPEVRGAAFGLRQSLDTVGAFLGPLAAVALLAYFATDLRFALWVAVVPAAASVLVLVFAVREPPPAADRKSKPPFRVSEVAGLPSAFWSVVAIGGVLTLARFSEAFLLLRAQDAGMALPLVPLVLVVMSAVYSVSAYPAGVLSDRIGRRGLLVAGLAVLIAADLVLATATSISLVFLGTALWGLHMGLTQGILSAMVADTAPARFRGTAFGMFSLVSGGALLGASVLAGFLWEALGPAATFTAGAALTALALLSLLVRRAGAAA